MYNDLFETRKRTILTVYPDATDICTPNIIGAQNNVLLAKTSDGEKVFKFGTPNLVYKNAAASQLYIIRNIAVPKIIACKANGLFFEAYDKISGIKRKISEK